MVISSALAKSLFCPAKIPARRSGPAVPDAGSVGILLSRTTGRREPDMMSFVFGERMADPEAEWE